jgi:hypothetical protein
LYISFIINIPLLPLKISVYIVVKNWWDELIKNFAPISAGPLITIKSTKTPVTICVA